MLLTISFSTKLSIIVVGGILSIVVAYFLSKP